MNHHSNESKTYCPLCEEKLKETHPVLAIWFKTKIKAAFPNVHISWAYRNQVEQEQAYLDKRTKLHFPHSAHNKIPALAIDLFQIDEHGLGLWSPLFFARIKTLAPENIVWGGVWKSLGDNDHFELLPNPEPDSIA